MKKSFALGKFLIGNLWLYATLVGVVYWYPLALLACIQYNESTNQFKFSPINDLLDRNGKVSFLLGISMTLWGVTLLALYALVVSG